MTRCCPPRLLVALAQADDGDRLVVRLDESCGCSSAPSDSLTDSSEVADATSGGPDVNGGTS